MPADEREQAEFTVPPNVERTLRLTARIVRGATFSARVAARQRPATNTPIFGRLLRERYAGMAFGVDTLAGEISSRFLPPDETGGYPMRDDSMALATHASPLRQVSAARQGAPGWRDYD
jgi:hypothetical protein